MAKRTDSSYSASEQFKKYLQDLISDVRVHGEVLRRVEEKVDKINSSVEKNTDFRNSHSGEVKIIYWVVGFVCIPVILLVIDNISSRI
jgi:predicted phage gp36 major capsid-like protein